MSQRYLWLSYLYHLISLLCAEFSPVRAARPWPETSFFIYYYYWPELFWYKISLFVDNLRKADKLLLYGYYLALYLTNTMSIESGDGSGLSLLS